MIEKLFVLAQIDVWMALGLSIVDLGQLITLEASPKNTSEKLGLGHACRLDPLRPPVMALVDRKVACIALF